jgi:hypothetical protein
MNYKTLKLALATLVLFSLKAYAQLDKTVKETFPAHVLIRVQDINSRIHLPVVQQMKLGAFYQHQDSLANISLAKGFPVEALGQYYHNDFAKLFPILTRLQLNDLESSYGNLASDLTRAVTLRNQLKLSATQIDIILNASDHQKVKRDYVSNKEQGIFLKGVLDNAQLRDFYQLSLQDKAKLNAKTDWELLKSGPELPIDSNSFLDGDYKFQKNVLGHTYYTVYFGTAAELVRLKDSIELIKPIYIHKVDILRGTAGNSMLASAYKMRHQLGLSEQQNKDIFDQLAQVQMQRAKARWQQPNVPFPIEQICSESLSKILLRTQYQALMVLAFKPATMSFTQKSWQQIQALGIAPSRDSSVIKNQIYTFRLNQLIIEDTTRYSKQYRKADSLRKFYDIDKPTILWKLDVFNNNLRVNEFIGVIKDRMALQISDAQTDTLINDIIQLNRDETAFHLRYSKVYFNFKDFQNTKIIAVLNSRQYTQYLSQKNYDQSVYNADKDWEALNKAHLITKDDAKGKVMEVNQHYELLRLVAEEKHNASKTPQTLSALRSVQLNKPQLLKRLDELNNEDAAVKKSKDSFAW